MKSPFLLILIGFVPLSWMMHGCCACTEVDCVDFPGRSIAIRYQDNPNDSIPINTIREFEIIKTDSSFNVIRKSIDSFERTDVNENEWSLFLDIQEEDRVNRNIFIINNLALSQKDTISDISFKKTVSEEVCNDCTFPCDDKTYMVTEYNEEQVAFNGMLQNGFEIQYSIRSE